MDCMQEDEQFVFTKSIEFYGKQTEEIVFVGFKAVLRLGNHKSLNIKWKFNE